jgi:L-ribulokinase
MSHKFTIGIDYGSDSVRSLIVNTSTGEELATHVYYYPRWKAGKYCNPGQNQFRQHPLDYLEGFEFVVKEALKKVSESVKQNVVGLSVDTTGSTPVAVNREGIPLSLTPEFAEDPDAMFILWKDHTSVKEANEINQLAKSWGGVDYTKYEGGIYSSEWFWAKLLHVIRKNEAVRASAFSWVEHCDWITGELTGNTDPVTLLRSRCAAGHKAMWHEEWGGLPSEEFLLKLDPLLKGLRKNLFEKTYTVEHKAGYLSPAWQKRLGLPEKVAIGTGAFDAHLGAVGGEIKPYYLSKVMGTSTCDMIVTPKEDGKEKLIKGICGQVEGSIIPGMLGLEAGQSAFGDIYAWFRDVLYWPANKIISEMNFLDEEKKEEILFALYDSIIPTLSAEAEKISPVESAPVALDWMNGRRTPDANQNLKGTISGLTLASSAPVIFRTLVEATAFGSKLIIDRFVEEGVRVDGVIALGGVAKKSAFVMQVVCDVLNMPILVARSEQTCALGSAMAASVAAGVHPSLVIAQQTMGAGFEKEYVPDPKRAEVYYGLYMKYKDLGKALEELSERSY